MNVLHTYNRRMRLRKEYGHEKKLKKKKYFDCIFCSRNNFYSKCVPLSFERLMIYDFSISLSDPICDETRFTYQPAVSYSFPILGNVHGIIFPVSLRETGIKKILCNFSSHPHNPKPVVTNCMGTVIKCVRVCVNVIMFNVQDN